MDEVDGRPGAVASQIGHLDATQGTRPLSLSPTSLLPNSHKTQFSFAKFQGESNENVPGK
jgi:hypothetical protein